MKLNFSSLAKKANNQEEEPIAYSKTQDATPQLNYYRKSIVQHKADNLFMKQRKSQLNEDSSRILLGSSILESYFSPIESSLQQTQSPKVNLSVMYPYQVSASINPSKIDQQIHSMKAKGILNESAIKFVKKEITKNLSKSKQKYKQTQKPSQSLNQLNQSIFLDTSIEVNDENLEDALNMTDKQFDNSGDGSILGTTVSSKLFKHFLKESTQKFLGQSKHLAHEKTSSIKQLLTPVTKKNYHKNNSKQVVTPHYMNPLHTQQKSNQTRKQLVPSDTLKLQQALKQVRQKPSLQLTKSSPFTQKVTEQRQSQYHSKKTSVFDSLYNQAYKRQCVNELNKQSKEKQIDERINQKKGLSTKRAKNYKVEGTFMQRLQKSIQRKYYKEYLTKKYSVNAKTGQPLFVPDTNSSKRTYEQLFHRSLQKLQTQPNDSLSTTLRNSEQQKRKDKKFSQIAMSADLSHTQKSGRQTKESSRNKHSQIEKMNMSIEIKKMNRSMEMMTKRSRKLTQSRSKGQVDKTDQQVIERIVRLFYPFVSDPKPLSKQKKGLHVYEQLGFQKTYQGLFQLSEKEYIILNPLFQQVQKLQKSSKITTLIFTNLLVHFYKKLNHYDKGILRQRLQNIKQRNNEPKRNSQMRCRQRAIENSIQSKSNNNQETNQRCRQRAIEKSVQSKSTNQEANQSKKSSYRPKINEISASMKKINPKYQAQLYYV